MWNKGKISKPVKIAMAKLSNALIQNNYEQAQNIHIALLVDYISEVTKINYI